MKITIEESDMTFGPYEETNCFHIEKSQLYKKIQEGIKIAEFLLLEKDDQSMEKIWIIEAKKSSPRPATQPNFDDFIQDIYSKMNNTLSVFLAMYLHRHENHYEELPTHFKTLE